MIQPSWVPPNLRFDIDDAELNWTFEPNSFDFIHNRNFVCSIRNWPRLVEQAYKYAALHVRECCIENSIDSLGLRNHFLGTNLEADGKGARLMAACFQAPGAVRALPWLH